MKTPLAAVVLGLVAVLAIVIVGLMVAKPS